VLSATQGDFLQNFAQEQRMAGSLKHGGMVDAVCLRVGPQALIRLEAAEKESLRLKSPRSEGNLNAQAGFALTAA
jgi:hypothetical protein